MSNAIKKLFALMLAITCLFTAAIAENDPVVATYEGGNVTLGEIEKTLASEINMMTATLDYYRQMMGAGSYELTEEDYYKLRESVAIAQAKFEILFSKMSELGVSDLTDEEKSLLRQNSEYFYLQNIFSLTQQGLSADDAAFYLTSQGVSVDSVYDNSYRNAIMSKIGDALEIDETVTDEDIGKEYEALTEKYEKNNASSPAGVESAANSGQIVYFMPENMRYIKHIILKSDDESLVSEFDAAVNKLMSYEAEYASVTSPSYVPKYDDIVEKAIKEECLENIALTKEKIASLQAKYLEAVKPVTDEILLAIENGESFDSLIETYSADPASKKDPIKTTGYLVYENSTIWDEAFFEAAKSLENVGDVSKPVCGTLGVYIVKYESKPEAGKIALEKVKDEIISSILSGRRADAFTAQSESWFTQANIQFNNEAFN